MLEDISTDMDIIENASYHKLLMMYKGDLSADELAAPLEEEAGSLENATVGYGVGNWFFYNGERSRANGIFQRILEGRDSQWAAFGYIAAEADVRSMRGGQ